MLLPPFPDKIEKHWLLNKEETALAVRRAAGKSPIPDTLDGAFLLMTPRV
jgi:hypothetical protein